MRFNRRMNGLECSFEGAPAILLRLPSNDLAFCFLTSQPVNIPYAGGR